MRLERRKTVIEAVDLEQVTRLADSLSPVEKRRLIAHLSGQLEIASLGGTPGADPPDKTGGIWPSKFAGGMESKATQRDPQGETASPRSRIPGLNAGEVWMSEDFNAELPDEFWFGEQ